MIIDLHRDAKGNQSGVGIAERGGVGGGGEKAESKRVGEREREGEGEGEREREGVERGV